jgi:hypothetical protein
VGSVPSSFGTFIGGVSALPLGAQGIPAVGLWATSLMALAILFLGWSQLRDAGDA